jgi:hypothetical protein
MKSSQHRLQAAGVKPPVRLRARPAVGHHPAPAMFHKQSGVGVTGRVHCPDTEQHKAHTSAHLGDFRQVIQLFLHPAQLIQWRVIA